MSPFQGLFSKTFSTLKALPLLFFFAQIPEALLTLLQKFVEGSLEDKPILGFLILFPLFCLASSFSGAFTFLLVLQREQGALPSIRDAWAKFKSHFIQILLAALTVGLFFVLGCAAFILPGLYFMSVYLFVPHLILSSDKKPLAAQLYASKKLVRHNKRTLIDTMCLILITIALGVGSYFLGQKGGEWAAGFSAQALGQGVLSTGIDILCSMLGGCLVDVAISHFYLNLKAKVANESNR